MIDRSHDSRVRAARVTTVVVVTAWSLACAAGLARAQVPRDTLRDIARVAAVARQLGAAYGDSIWPGYRPDTIPVLGALPRRGFVLIGWRRALPAGFVAVEGVPGLAWSDSAHGSTASTSLQFGATTVAQVGVSSMDPDYLLPTMFHEAFHVFERSSHPSDSWFGEAENAYYVASYPVFDVRNEAGFALEGRVLAAALGARTGAQRRALAREFVAVRMARLARLDPNYAAYDRASEMNEGLAEYALVRALELIAAHGPVDWRAGAVQRLSARPAALRALTTDGENSFRIRYYKTGPAMATLLDELTAGRWKQGLMTHHETLDEALAVASGFDAPARAWRDSAAATFGASALDSSAKREVVDRERRGAAQIDSALARPGLHLLLSADSMPNKDIAICGFDPQNLLAVTPSVQLHMRWVHACAGPSLDADLDTPTVHDDSRGTYRLVLGPADSVRITVAGAVVPLAALGDPSVRSDVVIRAPHARVTSSRCLMAMQGDTLRVSPLP